MGSSGEYDVSKSPANAGPSHADDHSVRDASISPEYRETKRGLAPRHVQLMTIGGSIGTALFVGIGSVLAKAGPLSVFLGFLFWSVCFIWPCTLAVAEMCAYLPIRGSVFELAARFVDPALGFAMGWTYFYAGVTLVCVEYSAVATVAQYWNATINPGVWVAMALVVCFTLNVVAVKWYGESEFIMASTKILLLIGLIMITFVTMCGGNPKHDAYGFTHWGNGNVMHAYYAEGGTGRFLGFWSVVVYSSFCVGGPDFVALAAAEIQDPRRTIPRVAKLILYRLLGFYVIGVLAVGIICSSRDSRLLGAIADGQAGSAASPWVIGLENLGIHGLPDLINFLILLSGWSCGNAYVYSSSRTLYGLAKDGHAPKFLLKCTKSGVPVYCVIIVSSLSCVTFLVTSNSSAKVFDWFVGLTTGGLILTYLCMLWTYLGWRSARNAQPGVVPDSSLTYQAPFMPYLAYFAIFLGCVLLLTLGFDTFVPFDVQEWVTSYFALAFGPFMFVLWKVLKKTHFVVAADADLVSGKAEVDEECKIWEEAPFGTFDERVKKMGFFRRLWEKIWY